MERDWNSDLFDDVGFKIKKVAKRIIWIGIVLSIVEGIAMLFWGFVNLDAFWFLIFLAPVVAAAGCFWVWLSAIILYGFGELIEKTCDNEENTKMILQRMQQNNSREKNGNENRKGKETNAPSSVNSQSTNATARYTKVFTNDTVVCSNCDFEQPSGQSTCENCGFKFSD